jgi:hypothetical protein
MVVEVGAGVAVFLLFDGKNFFGGLLEGDDRGSYEGWLSRGRAEPHYVREIADAGHPLQLSPAGGEHEATATRRLVVSASKGGEQGQKSKTDNSDRRNPKVGILAHYFVDVLFVALLGSINPSERCYLSSHRFYR